MKSKKSKKIVILIIAILAIISVATAAILVNNKIDTQATVNEWKENAIAKPVAGKLLAAGYIDISVKSADEVSEAHKEYGAIKAYKIYVNDKLIHGFLPDKFEKSETATTETTKAASDNAANQSGQKLYTHEFYATKTGRYNAYVEVDFENGSVVYSDVFTFYVSKKGMCVNSDMGKYVNAVGMKASWYYNWDLTPFTYGAYKDLEYVPMMWSYSDTADKYVERMAKSGYKNMLIYNEPDKKDQANFSVDKGVETWNQFMDKSIRISSPATALCPPWSTNWFQPFMKQIQKKGMDVDFVAVHHYWNCYTDEGVKSFLELIDKTYEMYNKPIWITEFAISGDPGKNDEQLDAVYGYMEGVIKGLEERDYVERYAWFSFNKNDERNGGSALFDKTTGELTKLGELYSESGNPEGYGDTNIKNISKNSKADKIVD